MTWDYIVVGAGSAGCAVAHQLVKTGSTVLVIEAGGWDRSPFTWVTAGQTRAMAKYDWGYQSQPDPSRHGRSEKWVRGRVLGGCSTINGTLFVRGVGADFNRWNIPGWSADEVMPIFSEIETSDQSGPCRGHKGPLHVRTVKRPHPITRAFVQSASASGYPFNPDYNGSSQEGVGYAQLSQHRGWRCSAADAFLKPFLRRKNLKLLLNAVVEKVEVDHGQAMGVSVACKGRRWREKARDIVICAGAINSPKLLMLSGIGDPLELIRHKIDVVLPLPGVGRNLQEQPLLAMGYRSRMPTNNLTEGLPQKLRMGAEFVFRGEGPISNLFEAVAFLKSGVSEPFPDLQVILLTFGYVRGADGVYRLAHYPSFLLGLMKSYPASRGSVTLAGPDPQQAPVIDCRLLQEQSDIDALISGVQTLRAIMSADPIASLVKEETEPGAGVQSVAALEAFVRGSAGISFHPIGTCRMGASDDAVVGPDLRVRGLKNLWVADASIMPTHLSANMNAPCMMIGTKLGKQLADRS